MGYRSILPAILVLGGLRQRDLIQGHPQKDMTPLGSPHVINGENLGLGMGGWGLVEGVLAKLTVL